MNLNERPRLNICFVSDEVCLVTWSFCVVSVPRVFQILTVCDCFQTLIEIRRWVTN